MAHISRRDVLKTGSALAVTALGTRSAFARETTARQKELYELAKKEGEVTWYTAHSNDTRTLGRTGIPVVPGSKLTPSHFSPNALAKRLDMIS